MIRTLAACATYLRGTWKGRFLFLLALIMLVGLACTLPSFGKIGSTQPTPTLAASAPASQALPSGGAAAGTPAAGQAVAPNPTPTVNLPPALVEVDPPPGSQIAPGTAPVLYFNQPMQHASVEAAFQAQPGQGSGGRFDWLDAATLRFTPAQPVKSGAGFDMTIGAGAKAANGLALAAPVQVHYAAASPLRLAERLPRPGTSDVNPSSAVVVTFNQPVVALGADPQKLPAAFSLDPAVDGRGEWLNTSTFIFYPKLALLGGTNYTVRMNTSLTSTAGAALAADAPREWTFSTAAPVLLSVVPTTERPLPLDAALKLTFNQPMDKADVEANFSLVSPGGGPVDGTFAWNDAATELTFTPRNLLDRGARYNLMLKGTARSLGGASMGRDYVSALPTVPQFAVTQTNPAAGQKFNVYSGYGSVVLTFSSPVAAGQSLSQLITINPPIGDLAVARDAEGYNVYLSGFFKPSTSYNITVSADLRDRWDAVLGAPFNFTFSSQPAAPTLTIPARQMGLNALFVPQNETSIPVRATNLTNIALQRGAIGLNDFIRAEQDYQGLQNWQALVQSSWILPVSQSSNENEALDVPLTMDHTTLEPGLYFLKMDAQPDVDSVRQTTPNLLVVSPVHLVLKTAHLQAFAWAVRIADQAPLADIRVNFYDNNGIGLASCTTDSSGKCQANLPPRDDTYQLIYAVTGQPGQDTFSLAASDWYQGIAPWEFSLPYSSKDAAPEVYIYTDRPIYRPGQTVSFRLIAKTQENGRYSPMAAQQLTVDVVSSYDPATGQSPVLATLSVPLDGFGAGSAVYTLPDDARPGTYVLRVKEVQFQEISFEVAEYRKPEIDLQVKFAQSNVQAGQDLQAKVSAAYFFGAPAGSLAVRWTLFRSADYLNLPDRLMAGPVDLSWLSPYAMYMAPNTYVMDGTAQTAPDGTLTITISGADLRDRLGGSATRMLNLNLEVTAEDESGLPVSARDTLRLHPSPYYVGVRPELWSATAGQEITYSIRSVDWDGRPVGDKPLSAHFRKVSWKQADTSDPSAPAAPTPEYAEIGSTDFRTSPAGDARLAFTPTEPGTYMLEISGADGALTQVLTWVGGQGAAPWPNLPNQRILLRSDASAYAPGQTARIFIPNPFPDGAQALVTVERSRVMESWVVAIEGASYEMQVPIVPIDAPNVYVSVVLLGRTNGRPDFRAGYVELSVDPAAQLLNVAVQTSPEQPQPGGDVTVNIRVKDAEGKPVQGAFSLALIDKAVLALADPNSPSIVDAFYGRQPLGVQSSLALVAYAGRMVYLPPGRGGGGGAEGLASASVRTKFEDTAFWNGNIQTDLDGVAQVQVKLPDNLTTWRADVRGLSGDARVGQAQVDLVVSKPLLIRPVTPRFVIAGDHLELAAMVFNNTPNTLRVNVRMEGAGFALDDPNQAALPVDLPAGGRSRVGWWGTVQDLPALDLTFSVESQGGSEPLRDAARPDGGPLPVHAYVSPQSFGTSGMLPDAGQQLELVSLPRSFTPLGGELTVELSPSLTAAIMDGLKALEDSPRDFTEPVLSRMLPNLATYQALSELKLDDPTLRATLQSAITGGVERLTRLQNENGGWGWASGYESDPYITSYVLFGLQRASLSGMFVDRQVLQKAQDYLVTTLVAPSTEKEGWRLDRLAFQFYALQESGKTDLDLNALYDFRDKLSPWGKAFLALSLEGRTPGDIRARTLVSDLESAASRSATGAHWEDANPRWHNWSTPNFTTAVVALAIARLDPASQVLIDATRYLVLSRQPEGGWQSSYESAWVLLALVETVRGTGDLQAGYAFSAALNDAPLIDGKVENPSQAVKPVTSTVPLANLRADAPNALRIQREAGTGRLYYRAFLRADRPARDAPAINRGLSITRQYFMAGQDCRKNTCQPLSSLDVANPQPVQVRLTLTVPEDMYYVVVEDYLPAGSEVLNPRLKTSQQNVTPEGGTPGAAPQLPYDSAEPFALGWGWWLFNDPQVYDDHVRWVVDYLPAGTYELMYRLTPFLSGEYQVLPAHAWQYYFPDVEGTSQGEVLKIR